MPRFFSVFGLTLKADRPIAGLRMTQACEPADVEVSFHEWPSWLNELLGEQPPLWYVSPSQDRFGSPTLQIWQVDAGAYFRLRYCDGVEFVIDRRGTQVWGRAAQEASPEEIAIYLLGPIMGLLLRLHDVTCLHGSAVAVDGQALAIVGAPGAGKSTTAAALARLGFPVLADDVVALRKAGAAILVAPAPPRLCLWPQSVTILFGDPELLPRLVPEDSIDHAWDKRALDGRKSEYTYQEQPLPLGAIYLLEERRRDAAPALAAISPTEALMALVSNSYRTEWLDRTMRESEFKMLSAIMDRVPVRRVIPHADPSYLPRLCQLILEDFKA